MIVLVVLIAVWMANILTRSIDVLIAGISRFRSGERQFRFKAQGNDEIGELSDAFDEMAESIDTSARGLLTTIDRNQEIIYVNKEGLAAVNKTLEDIRGKPYSEFSIYPANTPYDPIAALEEGREADVLYLPETDRYMRGNAAWLFDKAGEKSGYIITTVDVTDIIRVQKQLEQAVKEANLANQHKGDFLARMSHEIRTPMNAIIGMTEIVKKKMQDRDDVKADLRQIENSSKHLLGLINDILDISKIEAGKIELSFEATDLLKLAHTVETMIRPRCEEKNIRFETHFTLPSSSFYNIDPLRLRQVLINLLGNAIKFTHEGGTISYSITEKEKQDGKTIIDFSVADTGIGISKQAQLSLFKPFEQTSADISKRYGGTGLGLAISRSIVLLFGGDINVESHEGKGSAFSFELALSPCEAPLQDDIPQDASDKLTGKRALLVDDVAINRLIVANLLEYTGLTIDEASDGKEALEMFEKSATHGYDIIYMDIQMPNMDGYEACAAIRALDRDDAKTIPIIALTANAFKEDIDKALASGMNSHLAKPIEIDKCLEITFKVLKI
jgi:signal transduction histidine kinase/ActR/RegA family two-component response regulator